MTLLNYINKHFAGSQVKFAGFIGRPKQRVNEMIRKDYIIVNGVVYSKRFDLPPTPR